MSDYFDAENEQDEIEAIQKRINDGSIWRMEGAAGRRAMQLLEAGLCELGEKRFTDYWGNTVPSRYDVQPGTKGAPLSTRKTQAQIDKEVRERLLKEIELEEWQEGV